MTAKNILIIYAHPEPRSLNGSLKDFCVSELEKQGHNVKVSDLYAMSWKSEVDADDFLLEKSEDPMIVPFSSKEAFETGKLTEDVKAEQEKLLWADVVIFQFPLWWYSMPAIMKGWVDRVYAFGFAYGVGEHSDKKWGERFGEGSMKGKRAFCIVTMGGWEVHYSERGINGPMDDLLFPINHGVLYYPGFDVLPAFVAYQVMGMDEQGYNDLTAELRLKLENIFTEEPIPYRPQNAGDYTVPELTLKDDIDPGATGFGVHQK